MAIQLSDETRVITNPQKFAITQPSKVVTFINGEPPTGFRGKRSNPVINNIYSALITNRNQWAHVLALSTRTMMNEQTKTIELWVMLTNR